MKDVFQFETYDIDIKYTTATKPVVLFRLHDWRYELQMREWKEDCEDLGIEIIVEPQPCINYA